MLAQALEVERREADGLCDELANAYRERGAGLVLRNIAGGWRITTAPQTAPVVERYVLSSRHARLTKAALETLAIVAYKQPVTRHQISSIRGVNSDGVLRALVERGIVAEVGREEGPGRPMLYGTASEFLEKLGLPSLASLPAPRSAARRRRRGGRRPRRSSVARGGGASAAGARAGGASAPGGHART